MLLAAQPGTRQDTQGTHQNKSSSLPVPHYEFALHEGGSKGLRQEKRQMVATY